MTQLAGQEKRKQRVRVLRVAVGAVLVVLTVIAVVLGMMNSSQKFTSQNNTASSSLASASTTQCLTSSLPQLSPWTPTGVVWKLTVTFLAGSRHGQSEQSVMTFLRDGSLTATFPGTSASAPPTLPPAIDGSWCMTGINAFHYQFKDPILRAGKMVAYVAVHIEASRTSRTTFEAGGVGVAYSASSGQPIPGQYGVTQTFAVTSDQ
ncbi:MAG TPA: hypothetical protein VFV38_41255 [Ktedonobacteraceae bacterium]|nr:hypothetical protein [Ktedonobacteraceae bacterium]